MYARWGKAAFDKGAAVLVLGLGAPVFLLLALAVFCALGRPILFTQRRMGGGGWASMQEGSAPDAFRLCAFGRLLRASGLDELPQMINILRGDMSLVGPRPLPLEYGPLMTPLQQQRLSVRPGLLGFAQARGRNALPWRRRFICDVAYARRRPSLLLDLALSWRCLALVVRGHGASMPGHVTSAPLGEKFEPRITLS
jgi:lipopolysaccharide/colanic/teichoic acid biosynthesis glycosyltransferase